jgi:hypothetical protein
MKMQTLGYLKPYIITQYDESQKKGFEPRGQLASKFQAMGGTGRGMAMIGVEEDWAKVDAAVLGDILVH